MEISFIPMQILVYLGVNKTNFQMIERLRTRTRFVTEAKVNPEIAYCASTLGLLDLGPSFKPQL